MEETTLKLADPIDNVIEDQEATIELVEATMAIMSDPSLRLFHSLESNQNEMTMVMKMFFSIKNAPTMPYVQRA